MDSDMNRFENDPISSSFAALPIKSLSLPYPRSCYIRPQPDPLHNPSDEPPSKDPPLFTSFLSLLPMHCTFALNPERASPAYTTSGYIHLHLVDFDLLSPSVSP